MYQSQPPSGHHVGHTEPGGTHLTEVDLVCDYATDFGNQYQFDQVFDSNGQNFNDLIFDQFPSTANEDLGLSITGLMEGYQAQGSEDKMSSDSGYGSLGYGGTGKRVPPPE